MPFRLPPPLPAFVVAIAIATGCAPTYNVSPPVQVIALASSAIPSPSPTASSNWISAPPSLAPAIQTPFTARGDGTRLGIVATWELVAGLRHFKARHDGKRNFAVFLRGRGDARPGLLLPFNRIGRGSWTYAVAIDKTGDYFVDVTGDGAWEVSVE